MAGGAGGSFLLRAASGDYLLARPAGEGGGGGLAHSARAPDAALWCTAGLDSATPAARWPASILLRNRVTGIGLRGTLAGPADADGLEPSYLVRQAEEEGEGEGGSVAPQLVALQHGPDRLPSEYLAELEATGLVCVPGLGPRVVAHLRALVGREMAELEAAGRPEELEFRWSPAWGYNLAHGFEAARCLAERSHHFARAQTHPLMLQLMEAYMGDGGAVPIRAAHTPVTRITLPQDGSRGPGGGWHCDTPYNLQVYPPPQRAAWLSP
jgi:hypothetical protein